MSNRGPCDRSLDKARDIPAQTFLLPWEAKMKRRALVIACFWMVVLFFGANCFADRYVVSWDTARRNGWTNPLPSVGDLITNTNYDFDSRSYVTNHDNKRHAGVDLVVSSGTVVHAIAAGTVVHVVQSQNASEMVVIIRHSGSQGPFYCIYGHVYADISIERGKAVTAGQRIGPVKQSGYPSHLHFGINTSSSTALFMNDSRGLGWGRTAPRPPDSAVDPRSVGWVDPIDYLAKARCGPFTHSGTATATVLVMDVSGSMGQRWKGGVKIESAKKAALEFIEQVTHEAQTRGGQHQIGVVAFSDGARLLLPLTSDYNSAKQVIISLHATNWTNVGAGLTTAISEFNKVRSNAQRFIILLSDGNTNRGLSRDQILNGPVVEARQKKICIHTVAFGDPGDIDANFLRKVGIGSGCGTYSHAETAFELFSTYLKLRHKSLGQVIGEYSSIGRRVTILPGVPISLGTVLIGSGKRELHYTLAWSEQGRLQIRLKDPSGTLVSTSYPGVQIYTTDQFAHLTLLSPKAGAWTVEAAAGTSMPNGTEYYAVLSTRPGGIAIPLPLPIFTVGDRTFGLPSGLPTWLLVTISVTLIALVLYHELSGK